MMLIEREKEFELIESLVLNSIGNNDPLSIYISGPPGTGKTATVKALMQKLQQNKRRQKRVQVQTIIVDCFASFTESSLSNEILTKSSEIGCQKKHKTLEEYFTTTEKPILILLDEVDNLLSKQKNKIIYTAFNWPSKYPGRVILIGISNSLDLSERVLSKQKFLNPPHSIIFAPYTSAQLISILKMRLCKENLDQKTIELCARKVSSMTGDVRRAFDIVAQIIANKETEEDELPKVEKENVQSNDIMKTPKKSGKNTSTLKRPHSLDIGEITPKKNACREVLNTINKTMASPCQRSKLPQHPSILLATVMRLISNSSSINNTPTRSIHRTPSSAINQQSHSQSVSKDRLFQAYMKVCEHLFLSPLESDELDSAYEVLESQAMIKLGKTGPNGGGNGHQSVCFLVEMAMARQAINDNALLTSIEGIEL